MPKIPTMIEYIDNEWDEGDGLPGPSYRRKYGVDPSGPEAMGETQEQWNIRMERNELREKLIAAEAALRALSMGLGNPNLSWTKGTMEMALVKYALEQIKEGK